MSRQVPMKAVGNLLTDICRDLDIQYIGGPALGSVYMAQAAMGVRTVYDSRLSSFAVRENGSMEGVPPRGRTLLVDDVCTSGTSLRRVGQAVTKNGGEVVKAVVLVDRQFSIAGDLRSIYKLEPLIPLELLFPDGNIPT